MDAGRSTDADDRRSMTLRLSVAQKQWLAARAIEAGRGTTQNDIVVAALVAQGAPKD